MLIGIDASRANRNHKSGTEWYSYYLIRALADLDKHNHYILYTDTPIKDGLADLTANGEKVPSMPSVKLDGFQKIRSPHHNFQAKVLAWPFRFFWTQARLSLEMLWHRPDVLFIPAHALPIVHPKKSVVTIHDIGFRCDENLYEKIRIGAQSRRNHRFVNYVVRILSLGRYGANSFDYLEWSTRYTLKKAKQVIAISDFTKNELISTYGTSEKKIKVIYNGYPKQLYKPLPHDHTSAHVLARCGITKPYLFYVGRLEKKKNIAILIEAFASLKHRRGKDFIHKLCLVGDASFGFDEIKYTIQEYNLEKDIIVTGWVAEKDLPYIFAQADAFVFPSNYEGFGIPLLQAMATRTPIAASNTASIPEVAASAAVFFDPKNSEAMADALEKVLFDQSIREQLIQAGQIRIKDFSWEKTARETLELIEKM
ncbi:MAG TPA: glycosyltransferase family 1 protein [bacterium]|jgi:glycosyltransferase involved in cell wall biosynthesis|nr:glycosyltransferase family 1 protein [bacterium]